MKEYSKIYEQSKRNAKNRGIGFFLTTDEFKSLVIESGNTCAVSGILFDFSASDEHLRRPWAPSLDRVSSSLPYTKNNCRLVCVAVNIAMNEWGESVLLRIARAITRNEYELVAESVAVNIQKKVQESIAGEAKKLARNITEHIDSVLDARLSEMNFIKETPFKTQAVTLFEEGRELIRTPDLQKAFGGVSSMTIWRWVKEGVLPEPKKINNRNYWRAEEVNASIAADEMRSKL